MIRLALSMLLGDRTKYAGVLFGVAVTTFLSTLVGSMFAGMLSRTYSLVSDNPWADVWVTDPACQTVTQTINIPDTAFDRVRSVTGVTAAARLAVASSPLRLPHGRFVTVDVIGVDDATFIGLPPETPPSLASLLREPDAVLIDQSGTRGQLVVPVAADQWWPPEHPAVAPAVRNAADGDELALNNHRVRVRGEIRGSPRFNPQPVLYTSLATLTRSVPPTRHRLTFVLVKAAPGVSPSDLARKIEHVTGLRARTADQMKRETVLWFFTNAEFVSHIAVIVTFAAVTGLVITGLMLYIFTRENARQYATLKAMGATHARLSVMVLAQALFAGAVGFGVGLGACMLIGNALAGTGFPFRPVTAVPLSVGALSAVVAVLSALLSMRAVLRIDPAAVFKS